MLEEKKLPVGVDDFKELNTGDFFTVDKTRFIKELLADKAKVTLITRPRRFGKSMAMSMLKYFFSLEGAEENRTLFAGTDIERAGDPYMQEQGQWPVVLLSLKDIKPLTYDAMVEQMAIRMRELYKQYAYLLDENALGGADHGAFQDIICGRATENDLQFALSSLLSYLHEYHGKPVILLIDEYDAPIQAAWSAPSSYYDEAIAFMRTFFTSALKGNTSLHFGVLTGVLRIAKESIFSALNNLAVSSVVKGKYADSFGFTAEETAKLAADLGREDKLPELKEWYDGYVFSGYEIYNPWSVVNYFASGCSTDIFWLNTSGNGIIADLVAQAKSKDMIRLRQLLEGRTFNICVNEGIIYTDIYSDPDALYTMLLTTGYLKSVETKLVEGEPWCKVMIPNREIRVVYRREILVRYSKGIGRSGLAETLECLLSGDAEEFALGLGHYLEAMASLHDTAEKEAFYHGFVLGIMTWLMPKYRVVSNRESGYGRFDIGIFPREQGIPGIVMEFKVADSEAALEETAQRALAQVDAKDYLAEFREQGVTEVWRYGVAFCGKKIWLAAG